MRLSQLKYLVAIADAGSFRAAARRLGCAQPTLTKSIGQLEDEIGFRIFDRVRSGVVPTDRGMQVVRQARMVLFGLDRLEDEIASRPGHERGLIRLGVSPAVELGILPDVVTRFSRDWPGYELVVTGSLYPHGLKELREGEIDLLIGPLPQDPVGGQLSVETLLDTSTIVVARPAHPRAKATSLTEIAESAWLIHGPAEGPSSLYAEAFRSAGLVPPRATLRSQSLAFTLTMLGRADYFCVLSDHLLARIAAEHGLVRVPIAERLPSRTLALMVHERKLELPAITTLVRLLRLHAARLVQSAV